MSVTLNPVLSEASSGGNVALNVGESAVLNPLEFSSPGGVVGCIGSASEVSTVTRSPQFSPPIADALPQRDESTLVLASPKLTDDDEEEEEEDDAADTTPDKDDSTPGFGDDLDDADDDLDEFDDIDEDDFDDDFDDDFEEELDDDYEIEIDDEISAEFGLNTAGEDLSAADDDLDDFEDFETVD